MTDQENLTAVQIAVATPKLFWQKGMTWADLEKEFAAEDESFKPEPNPQPQQSSTPQRPARPAFGSSGALLPSDGIEQTVTMQRPAQRAGYTPPAPTQRNQPQVPQCNSFNAAVAALVEQCGVFGPKAVQIVDAIASGQIPNVTFKS